VTVAKQIEFSCRFMNLGASLVKQVKSKVQGLINLGCLVRFFF